MSQLRVDETARTVQRSVQSIRDCSRSEMRETFKVKRRAGHARAVNFHEPWRGHSKASVNEVSGVTRTLDFYMGLDDAILARLSPDPFRSASSASRLERVESTTINEQEHRAVSPRASSMTFA